MKKLLLSIAAAFALFTSTAQWSYVSLYINMNAADSKWVSARVSGDIPASMKDYYAATYDRLSDGELINMLANEGFTIDKIAAMGETNCVVIMSKNSSSDSGIITKSADEQVTNAVEIARYDLQGRLVDDDCPGLQIVVYSDYSAKTVVVK